MLRFFPIFYHIILACVVIGAAVGADTEGVRPIIQYSLNGAAAGLGVTAFIRFVFGDESLGS